MAIGVCKGMKIGIFNCLVYDYCGMQGHGNGNTVELKRLKQAWDHEK